MCSTRVTQSEWPLCSTCITTRARRELGKLQQYHSIASCGILGCPIRTGVTCKGPLICRAQHSTAQHSMARPAQRAPHLVIFAWRQGPVAVQRRRLALEQHDCPLCRAGCGCRHEENGRERGWAMHVAGRTAAADPQGGGTGPACLPAFDVALLPSYLSHSCSPNTAHTPRTSLPSHLCLPTPDRAAPPPPAAAPPGTGAGPWCRGR